MRYVQARSFNLWPLAAINYAFAGLLALAYLLIKNINPFSCEPSIGVMGSCVGIMYFVHLMIMFQCIKRVGVGIAATVASVSAVSPVLFSWIVWQEALNTWQIAALMLVPFMMYLCRAQEDDEVQRQPANAWLAFNFIIASAISICHDIVDRIAVDQQIHYLSFLFISAGIVSVAFVCARRMHFVRASFSFGSILGLVNIAATLFGLLALLHLQSVLVFPVASSAIIIGSTLLAYVLWREKIIQRQAYGIAGCVLVIVLINIHSFID